MIQSDSRSKSRLVIRGVELVIGVFVVTCQETLPPQLKVSSV